MIAQNKLITLQFLHILLGSFTYFTYASIADDFNSGKTGGSCTLCLDQYQNFRDFYEINNDLELMCKRVAITKNCLSNVQKNIRRCRSNIRLQVFRMGFKLEIKRYNCEKINITLSESRTNLPVIIKTTPRVKTHAERCEYTKKMHAEIKGDEIIDTGFASRHCGLFGDPHLRTFTAQNQTCVVDGAWPLYNSMHLAVQVTNVKLSENPRVTATKKITVLIKNDQYSNCVEQKIYQVTAGYVPTIFRDGTSSTGPKGCQTRIIGETNGVRLELCHINTTIVIRQVGKYLTFGMNIPDEFHSGHGTSGLCVNGCPNSELIDYKHFFETQHPNTVETTLKHPMTNKEAFLFCEKANLTDFYFDSCLFDLMTTGDELFASSAQTAMDDAMLLNPKLRLTRDNSVALSKKDKFLSGYYDINTLKTFDNQNSGSKISKEHLLVLISSIFSWTFLSWTL